MDKKCKNCAFYNLGVCTYMPDVDMTGCVKEEE